MEEPLKPTNNDEDVMPLSQASLKISKAASDTFCPPWPEWSDEFINNESWKNDSRVPFEDPTNSILPPSLVPVKWVRPTRLHDNPVVVDWTQTKLNLVTKNVHLCKVSELIRIIISEISELYNLALGQKIKQEGEGTVFNRNSEGGWKPWDHIYSKCKAGVKGQQPLYNSNGRYYVRLYYLGHWRRIAVDDRIPILRNGLNGLPLGEKFELWPMLLTKALLKIAYLSWDNSSCDEIQNFSPISCLTGWIHEWVEVTEPASADQLWKDLAEDLPKYHQPDTPHIISHESGDRSEQAAGIRPEMLTVMLTQFPDPNNVMKDYGTEDSNYSTPPSFLSHPIQLSHVRDCTLIDPNRPRTPLWKRYRWKAWAMKKGLIPMDSEQFKDAIQDVRISSPFFLDTNWSPETNRIVNVNTPSTDLETDGMTDEGFGFHLRGEDEGESENPYIRAYEKAQARKAQSGTARSTPSGAGGDEAKGQPEPKEASKEKKKPSVKGVVSQKSREPSAANSISKVSKERLIPKSACISVWVDLALFGHTIQKFCKFFASNTEFGSCIKLIRDASTPDEEPEPLLEQAQEPSSTPDQLQEQEQEQKPSSADTADQLQDAGLKSENNENEHEEEEEDEEEEAHEIQNSEVFEAKISQPIPISFDNFKTINLSSAHVNDMWKINENGFYLLTDSSIEQEIMLSLEVLQSATIDKFKTSMSNKDGTTGISENEGEDETSSMHIGIGIHVEMWDWVKDQAVSPPIFSESTKDSFLVCLTLKPGRNSLRLCLYADFAELLVNEPDVCNPSEETKQMIEIYKKEKITQFSLKILSKWPIYVGNHEEVQSYMLTTQLISI